MASLYRTTAARSLRAIAFGIALGYEDPSVPANACRTTREPLEANVHFV